MRKKQTLNVHGSAVCLNQRAGIFIRRRRIARGLTGSALGQILHLSQQQISRYERGMNAISLHQMNLFIQGLGASWDDFKLEVIDAFLLDRQHMAPSELHEALKLDLAVLMHWG